MPPFFSIVIPVYNRFDLLKETLESIFKQSFQNFEVIIVDDGSAEDISQLSLNNQANHKQVRIIRQQNSERGAARNNGFRNATGDYVVFLDSDDLMHKNHLETLYQEINRENFPNFIATKFNILRTGNKIFPSVVMSLKGGYYDYKTFLSGNHLACNFAVKKNNPALKLFEEDRTYSIVEDWMFLISNLRKDRIYVSDKITLTLLDHPDRSMRSDNKLIIEKTWKAVDWIKKNVDLAEEDKIEIEAHANYFSAIHSYADHDRKASQDYLRHAVKLKGWNKKYTSLMIKTFVGHKLLSKLR